MDQKPIKVLIIDDDPDFRFTIKERLSFSKEPSFHVESCDKLSVAYQCVQEGKADVILLDLNLKDIKGLETLSWVLSRIQNIPVIVVTGQYDESTGIAAVKEGAQDYLLKGQIDPHTLARSIRYGIERKKQQEELRRQKEQVERAHAWVSATVASTPSIMVFIDHENRIKVWNPQAEQVLGVASTQVIDKPISNCGLDWEFKILDQGLKKCRRLRTIDWLDDIKFNNAKGETRILGLVVRPFVEPSGISVLIFGADITEKKQLES